MLMTPCVTAVAWFSSVLSLPNLTLGISPESCSMTGPMRLHGPHHGAQKSTRTTPCWLVNLEKSESVTVETAPAMSVPSRLGGIKDSVRESAGVAAPSGGAAPRARRAEAGPAAGGRRC